MPIKYDIRNCRICNCELSLIADLGQLPLSNNYELTKESSMHCMIFPLQLMYCGYCLLYQLSTTISGDLLFSNYTFRSSISKSFRKHCNEMAESLAESFDKNSSVLDIAGNDGTLLEEFRKYFLGAMVNVEPAKNIAEISKQAKITTISEFWPEASQFLSHKFDIITATNVFAHFENPKSFLIAARQSLNPYGNIVIEVPYAYDMIEKKEYDTIYQEHIYYYSIYSIWKIAKECGLNIKEVSKLGIHGGSLRFLLCSEETSFDVNRYFYSENTFFTFKNRMWQKEILKNMTELNSEIKRLKSLGKKIVGFGAAAKGNTLVNCSKLHYEMLDYIIDETPEKIGKYYPYTDIKIAGLEKLYTDPPDYILILSWNYKEEIISKLRQLIPGKSYIVPIPELECGQL